jgi:hypothetical protein
MGKKLEGFDLQKISINFPRDLWKKLRLKALQGDTTVTQILVELVERDLGTKSKKGAQR